MKSIIFCPELIPPILKDIKIQTRRVIDPQPDQLQDGLSYKGSDYSSPKSKYQTVVRQCPYGKVGDKLWVKEAWSYYHDFPSIENIIYKGDGYKPPIGRKWRHARRMPQWASRITLEITDIRVERLQEIDYLDICLEGWDGEKDIAWAGVRAKYWFKELWNSLHKKGEKWEDNPFVWVIGFRRDK